MYVCAHYPDLPLSCMYAYFFNSFPADPSLTSSSVLATLKTVHNLGHVWLILGVSVCKRDQLRMQHVNDDDYRAALVEHYLKTSPYTSWGYLGGKCQCKGEKFALYVCQRNMQHDEGMGICSAGMGS